MKIYTKRGDKGQTSLLSGQNVPKNHLRVEAYGTVDELNAHIGMLAVGELPAELRSILVKIQNILFVAGSQLAVEGEIRFKLPEVSEAHIEFLEQEIDRMEADLPTLTNFILPGGSTAVVHAHVCRTVCRRAERTSVALADAPDLILKFLNRLSDYFFVLARYIAHHTGTTDTIWNKDI